MNIGKKILSAFVEVTDKKPVTISDPVFTASPVQAVSPPPPDNTGKFRQHFESLLAEANQPGPDYYEFAKMVEAMKSLPDEGARYQAAYAGLSVQGLDKEKLLASAAGYLKMVEADATAFQQSLTVMRTEKVEQKKAAKEEKEQRIEQLSQEVTALHNRISELTAEIREAEEKIATNGAGYRQAAEGIKAKIAYDVEKIREHLA